MAYVRQQSKPIDWSTLTLEQYLANEGGARSQLAVLSPRALAKIELYLWLRAMGVDLPLDSSSLISGPSLAEAILGAG